MKFNLAILLVASAAAVKINESQPTLVDDKVHYFDPNSAVPESAPDAVPTAQELREQEKWAAHHDKVANHNETVQAYEYDKYMEEREAREAHLDAYRDRHANMMESHNAITGAHDDRVDSI